MDKAKIVSISVAAGLILAGIVGFIVYIEVVQEGVEMTVSDTDVTVGEFVNFTAEGGSDDLSFRWEFGDGVNATGRRAQHFYRSIGEFNATLFVDEDSEWTEVDTAKIAVSDLTFRLPAPRDGDVAVYQVTGSVNMSNSAGLFNTQVGGHNISLTLVKLTLEGPLEAEWSVSEAYDTFGNLHDALSIDHRLDSVVGGKTFVKSEVGTTISDIAGDLWLNASELIDLDTNGTLSMSIDAAFDSTQGILGSNGIIDENATLFRDQRIPSLLAVAQAGLYGRDYSMSMPGYSVPGVIAWEFVGPESVDGRPAYRLRGTSPLVEGASVDVWASPYLHKLPRMAISLHATGNATIDLEVNALLVSENRGESPIPYGECRRDFVYHLLPFRSGLETASQVQKRLLPADGTNESWYGLFTPRKAIEFARANDAVVSDFMRNNTDTFAQSAQFSVGSDGSRQWAIELWTSENSTDLTFVVVNETGTLSVIDAQTHEASVATQRPAAKTIITFAQAERLLAGDPSLAPIYNGSRPSDWVMTYYKNLDLGLGDLAGMASLLSGLPSGEVFVFSRADGSAFVMLDADNGAVTFIDQSATSVSILG